MSQTFDDVACTVCGCVCDDLRLTVEGGRVVAAVGACSLAEPRLLGLTADPPRLVAVDGKPKSLGEAIAEAATLLSAARLPLVYGLSQSSTEGQRAACRLADHLGGVIDTTASLCHAPSIVALQQVGESTCSLGEVRHRADLIVYWGSNPVVSHPRHLERYSADAHGQFAPHGRAGRKLIVVDIRRTETAELADTFLQVLPGGDFEILWALRTLVAGHTLPSLWRPPGGLELDDLHQIAQQLTACRSGVFFFGLGLARHGVGHANVEALLRLTSDLNRHTRFYARRMRVYGDVAGADSVLCWQTGFPFSVDLSRGYPRYSPGEYSANQLLERREVDACLLIGLEGLTHLSTAAWRHLRSIPTILLDPSDIDLDWQPTIRIRTARYGIHRSGTAYRMDEVPIPLRQVVSNNLPSDGDVLIAIQDAARLDMPRSAQQFR